LKKNLGTIVPTQVRIRDRRIVARGGIGGLRRPERDDPLEFIDRISPGPAIFRGEAACKAFMHLARGDQALQHGRVGRTWDRSRRGVRLCRHRQRTCRQREDQRGEHTDAKHSVRGRR
jgi:hypothetical protein